MAAQLHLHFAGIEAADRRLQTIMSRLEDPAPVWQLIVDSFQTLMDRRFVSEGSYGTGRPWEPLSANYAAWKVAHSGGGILELSGLLRTAITEMQPDVVMTRHQVTISPDTAILPRPYAKYHQEGTTRMPARPIIPRPIPIATRNEWAHIVQQFVFGGV